jgi:hypothetical protein
VIQHRYKIWPDQFKQIIEGSKTFEWRKDDRDPAPLAGDGLLLQEWDPVSMQYTGREVHLVISYVLRDSFRVPPGWVILGFRSLELAALKQRLGAANEILKKADCECGAEWDREDPTSERPCYRCEALDELGREG